MKNIILSLLVFLHLFTVAQVEVSGVEIPSTFKVENTILILNGAGIREKYFVDLFVAALYLKTKSQDALKIMNANETMVFKLHIVSNLISSDRMKETTSQGFERATEGNTVPISKEIEQFMAVFTEKVKKGDVYDFVYVPFKGTYVYKNKVLSVCIPGLDFKRALFGIWLFKKPPDSDIHDKLLGK